MIKKKATHSEFVRVFEGLESPRNIFAFCTDGPWIREVFEDGEELEDGSMSFDWKPWKKVDLAIKDDVKDFHNRLCKIEESKIK